jgi:hypothetical protein
MVAQKSVVENSKVDGPIQTSVVDCSDSLIYAGEVRSISDQLRGVNLFVDFTQLLLVVRTPVLRGSTLLFGGTARKSSAFVAPGLHPLFPVRAKALVRKHQGIEGDTSFLTNSDDERPVHVRSGHQISLIIAD